MKSLYIAHNCEERRLARAEARKSYRPVPGIVFSLILLHLSRTVYEINFIEVPPAGGCCLLHGFLLYLKKTAIPHRQSHHPTRRGTCPCRRAKRQRAAQGLVQKPEQPAPPQHHQPRIRQKEKRETWQESKRREWQKKVVLYPVSLNLASEAVRIAFEVSSIYLYRTC